MCNMQPNPQLDEQRMLYVYQGINIAMKLLNQHLDSQMLPKQPETSSDVLATATTAYQQGKITKAQFMAVIDALDEQTYQTRAYSVPVTAGLDIFRR